MYASSNDEWLLESNKFSVNLTNGGWKEKEITHDRLFHVIRHKLETHIYQIGEKVWRFEGRKNVGQLEMDSVVKTNLFDVQGKIRIKIWFAMCNHIKFKFSNKYRMFMNEMIIKRKILLINIWSRIITNVHTVNWCAHDLFAFNAIFYSQTHGSSSDLRGLKDY